MAYLPWTDLNSGIIELDLLSIGGNTRDYMGTSLIHIVKKLSLTSTIQIQEKHSNHQFIIPFKKFKKT